MKRQPHVRAWFNVVRILTWNLGREGASTADAATNSAVELARAESDAIRSNSDFSAPLPPTTWRRWAVATLLVLLPVGLYWSTIRYDFGFRDDYSMLREAHEEPGKILKVCAMQARPLFGVITETSFRQLQHVGDLWRVRLMCALLSGGVAAGTFLLLRYLRWDRWTAALLGALLVVLPSTQIVVAWAVAGALPIALLLSLAGFVCAERCFVPRQGYPATSATARTAWWAAAVLLVCASALIYQPNSLYYFAATAAALWAHRRWRLRHSLEWLVRHVVTAVIGLGLAFTGTTFAFARGWVPASGRIALEHDWLDKAGWFFHEPLQNALALIALNDDSGPRIVHRLAALIGLVTLAGIARAAQTRGWRHGLWLLGAIGALCVGSFAVNLLVDDQWPVYRVLLPLTGTIVVTLSMSLLTLGGRWLARGGLAILLPIGAWLAVKQPYELIAVPQGIEWEAVKRGAAPIRSDVSQRVLILTPKPENHIAARVFSDEFGSLSTDSDWVPKEMLQHVIHQRFPDLADVNTRYEIWCGRERPPHEKFDVIIDLRRLR